MNPPDSIGRLLTAYENYQRDAIHVAIAPMVAAETLTPGQACHVRGDGLVVTSGAVPMHSHGVVDPFLESPVPEGGRFWMFLRPGTITSLRHEWAHPAFPSGVSLSVPELMKQESEQWLRLFAEDHRMKYVDLVDGAASGKGAKMGVDSVDDTKKAEFWQHVENVTGRRFDDNHRDGTYFFCGC